MILFSKVRISVSETCGERNVRRRRGREVEMVCLQKVVSCWTRAQSAAVQEERRNSSRSSNVWWTFSVAAISGRIAVALMRQSSTVLLNIGGENDVG